MRSGSIRGLRFGSAGRRFWALGRIEKMKRYFLISAMFVLLSSLTVLAQAAGEDKSKEWPYGPYDKLQRNSVEVEADRLNIWAGDVQLQISRHEKSVVVADTPSFVTNVVDFVQSASVDATSSGGGLNRWQEVLASGSFIHLTYPSPRTFRLPVSFDVGMVQNVQKWEERAVNEILVSLPEGDYPGIQLRSGTNYMAVTKYNPRLLKRLVMEPALGLSTVKPYDDIYNVK